MLVRSEITNTQRHLNSSSYANAESIGIGCTADALFFLTKQMFQTVLNTIPSALAAQPVDYGIRMGPKWFPKVDKTGNPSS